MIHAALWQNGAVADLGAPPAYTWSYAGAINDSGQIVGYAQANAYSTTADAFSLNKGTFSVLGSFADAPDLATAMRFPAASTITERSWDRTQRTASYT